MNIPEKRLVLEFEEGVTTFRRFRPDASLAQLLALAEALNRFQEPVARRVLLVTSTQF